jgi:acyl-CoA thioesterase FadM
MWSLRRYSSAATGAKHFTQKWRPVRSGSSRGGGSSCMAAHDSSGYRPLVLLLIRFLTVVIAGLLRPRIDPHAESVVRFTVLPNDCDLNFHLNAGRFVSFMDIARVELLARMRLLPRMVRRGWRPIMGGVLVRYRRSVLPFERFDVRSRVLAWDEKWFYLEHVVEKDGVFCAVGHVRALIRRREGNVPPSEVLELMGVREASPELPEAVARWRELEDAR